MCLGHSARIPGYLVTLIIVLVVGRMSCVMAEDPGLYSSFLNYAYIWLVTYSCVLMNRYPDEFESTRIIGDRQFKKASELFTSASEKLNGKIDYRHAYLDFSQLEVTLPKQGGGSETVKTCPAAMGFAFAAGTTDGPGAFDFTQGDNTVSNKSHRILFQLL